MIVSYLTLRRLLGKKENSSKLMLFTLVWFLRTEGFSSSEEEPGKQIKMALIHGNAETTCVMFLFRISLMINRSNGRFTQNYQNHLWYMLVQTGGFLSKT